MIEFIPILLLVLNAIQILWWVFLLFQIPKRDKTQTKTNTDVSVIISARNEYANLEKHIPKFLQQEYDGDWELIVVDDRSEDESINLLNNLSAKFPRLRVLVQKEEDILEGHSTKKSALVKAINAARFNTILQTDADCYPNSNDWIKTMIAHTIDGNHFTIGLSHYESRKSFLNQIIQFETSLTAMNMLGMAASGNPYMSLGRNQLFSKSRFKATGGFSEFSTLAYGDDDLLLQSMNEKNKVAICVTKAAQTVSIPEENWRSWFNQKLRHTMAGKYYKTKFKTLLAINYLSLPIYLLFILSFFVQSEYALYSFVGIAVRAVFVSLIFLMLRNRVGGAIKWWNSIFYDIFYSILAFGFALLALSKEKIEWR